MSTSGLYSYMHTYAPTYVSMHTYMYNILRPKKHKNRYLNKQKERNIEQEAGTL